jgi:hypothetical protein
MVQVASKMVAVHDAGSSKMWQRLVQGAGKMVAAHDAGSKVVHATIEASHGWVSGSGFGRGAVSIRER